MRRSVCIAALVLALMLSATSRGGQDQSAYRDEVRAGLEEISVSRTTRTTHVTGSTPGCASAPFATLTADHYDLWSMALRSSDARVVKTHERPVGGFDACFGEGTKDYLFQMYATGKTANVPWTGLGGCARMDSQPPLKTVVAYHCQLNLSGLPDAYGGGFLASSTVAPNLGKGADPKAHVRGYLSTSVIVLRLWRKPPASDVTSSQPAGK
jgi:hypothetical protein